MGRDQITEVGIKAVDVRGRLIQLQEKPAHAILKRQLSEDQ
jgi:hypothetical protein